MDPTQLANLGEFIGGVAVPVALIYLGYQVQPHNSCQMRHWIKEAVTHLKDSLVRSQASGSARSEGYAGRAGVGSRI